MRSTLALLYRTLSTMSSPRSYAAAIDALNSLQSNAAVIDAIRKSGTTNGEPQMVEGVEDLKRIGYTVSHSYRPRKRPYPDRERKRKADDDCLFP